MNDEKPTPTLSAVLILVIFISLLAMISTTLSSINEPLKTTLKPINDYEYEVLYEEEVIGKLLLETKKHNNEQAIRERIDNLIKRISGELIEENQTIIILPKGD